MSDITNPVLTFIAAHDTVFDPAVHATNSYDIFDLTITENEDGDIVVPHASATIRNPGIAGIASQPERYAVISVWSSADGAQLEIFRGRLTALPVELGAAEATLEFIAVPPDEDEVLKAAAEPMRIGEIDYDPDADPAAREAAEQYDPLYFDANAADDPATVLLARPQYWLWNRTTLQPELSHFLNGTTTHLVTDILEGTLSLRVTQPPKFVMKLRVTAAWTQEAHGKQASNHIGTFNTFTYQDFIGAIPKGGDAIGNDTGWKFDSFEASSVPMDTPLRLQANSPEYGDAAGGYITLRPHTVNFNWRAAYDYIQARQETLDISMPSAIQPVLGDQKTETVEQLTLGQLNLDLQTEEWMYEDPDTLEVKEYSVGDRVAYNGYCYTCLKAHTATEKFVLFEPVEDGEQLWIGVPKRAAIRDMRTPTFFSLDRGIRAQRYAIRRLQRTVLKRSRAAELSAEVPLSSAIFMTLKDRATFVHRIIPGGQATGKITGLEFRFDGASRVARVTIQAPVGDGSAAPTVEEDNEKQTGDVVYTENYGRLSTPVNAYALANIAPVLNVVDNTYSEQAGAAEYASFSGVDPLKAIGQYPTRMSIAFPPIHEEDLLHRRIAVSCKPIHVPKGIDIKPTV